MHSFGDVRLDWAPGAANALANVTRGFLPIRDQVIGTAFSRHLLEHLPNVGAFLREVRRVLQPEGEVVIITDNAGYLTFHLGISPVVGQSHRPGGYTGPIAADRHYALFTDAHLANLLDESGFTILCVRYVDAFDVGLLCTRPPLQRTQQVLARLHPRIAHYAQPYFLPHLIAVAKPKEK